MAESIEFIGRSLQAPSTIPFLFGGIVGQNLSATPLTMPLFYPSIMVHHLAGGDESRLRKISWIAPALGMSVVAFTGRVVFDLMSNNLLKGIVFGVHACAMRLLANIPSASWAGMITLRSALGDCIQLKPALETLSNTGLKNALHGSEVLSGVALVTTSFALSVFGGFHIITANAIAHVAAAVTAAVVARMSAIIEEQRPQPELQQPA